MRFYQRRVQIPAVVQSALKLWERRRWFEAAPEDLGKLATTATARSTSQSARKNQLAWISQEVTASELMIAVPSHSDLKFLRGIPQLRRGVAKLGPIDYVPVFLEDLFNRVDPFCG